MSYNTEKKQSIRREVKDDLCIGCGTCLSICPKDCITLGLDTHNYIPLVNEHLCSNCGLCTDVCPRNNPTIDYNKPIKTTLQCMYGTILERYVGYSTDEKIRFHSSSGGLITQLLLFALEEKIIDGAIVVAANPKNPLKPLPKIARTKEEILSAMGSKYCPIPLNIIIRKVKQTPGKYAIVGLPCQIAGVKKLEEKIVGLKEKIVLHFGLFCGHILDFEATSYFLYCLKIDPETVVSLRYRGEGWPGFFSVTLANGQKKRVPYSSYSVYHKLFFFTPKSCFFCPDPIAIAADISFGDAWISEIIKNDPNGTSVCIARTEKGQRVLKAAIEKRKIHLDILTDIQAKTALPSTFRLRRISARNRLLNRPTYASCVPKLSDYFFIFLYLFNDTLCKQRLLWSFIPCVSTAENHFYHKLLPKVR